jgi:CheY-like chemotaxis protein
MGVPPQFVPLAGVLALVVDDNEDARIILESVLTHAGALVTAAESAHKALNILGQVRVDIVVCDVNLGDNDAIWLIRRAHAHGSQIPFVAISAQDYDEFEMRLAGFAAYLRKPVQQHALVGAIVRSLGRGM